jgi:hypothetical protein
MTCSVQLCPRDLTVGRKAWRLPLVFCLPNMVKLQFECAFHFTVFCHPTFLISTRDRIGQPVQTLDGSNIVVWANYVNLGAALITEFINGVSFPQMPPNLIDLAWSRKTRIFFQTLFKSKLHLFDLLWICCCKKDENIN